MTAYGGVCRIRLTASGWATRLYRSGIYNIGSLDLSDLAASVSVDQYVVLSINAATEGLSCSALGPPIVTINYNGPYADEVKGMLENQIASFVQANLEAALHQARNALNAIATTSVKDALLEQLRILDETTTARFDSGEFHPGGLTLRGTVSVAYRHRPEVKFEKLPSGDGFDAIESWIPGGRVDSFEWTWRWFTSPIEKPPSSAGRLSAKDTFLLRRPPAKRSKFGLAVGLDQPLPGLDGFGKMCLTVRGVHIDHVTGALVSVTSVKECEQFGYLFKMPYEVGPYLRICDPLLARELEASEIGIMQVGARDAETQASNALVVHLQDSPHEDIATALREGLEGCRRDGAGLLLILLFKDGVLSRGGRAVQASLSQLIAALPAAVVINEDVYESWSKALSVSTRRGEPAWRLISPSGLVTWAHDGRVEPELLASALERRLEPSRPPSMVFIRPDTPIGAKVPIEMGEAPCPPAPLGRLGLAGSKVVFVQKDAISTLTQLERLARERTAESEEESFVAVIVEGANASEVDALRAQIGVELPMLPDADGTITRRVGVRFSPTIMTLDQFGRLAGVEMGLGPAEQDTIRTRKSE
jgi:hypothetical protein